TPITGGVAMGGVAGGRRPCASRRTSTGIVGGAGSSGMPGGRATGKKIRDSSRGTSAYLPTFVACAWLSPSAPARIAHRAFERRASRTIEEAQDHGLRTGSSLYPVEACAATD